jgi:APA family basic amino acid/polyamine antiporter
VLRREPRSGFFRSPGPTPVLAALLCLALIIIPWGERDPLQYKISAAMLGIGVVLWLFTWLTNRAVRAKKTGFRDIEHMEDDVL